LILILIVQVIDELIEYKNYLHKLSLPFHKIWLRNFPLFAYHQFVNHHGIENTSVKVHIILNIYQMHFSLFLADLIEK